MRTGTTFLLGAGASMDAGLPNSYRLTRIIYEKLLENRDKTQAILFGYIISKLVGRRVLAGGSPFEPVNIEDAYDALLRLISRESDIVSEFVYSWDPILDALRPKFNEDKFIRGIVVSIQDQSRVLRSGHIVVNTQRLRESARAITAALGESARSRDSERVTKEYIDILVGILSSPSDSFEYLDDIFDFVKSKGSTCIATLNYDLLLEGSAQRVGVDIDYGLDRWSERKLLSWRSGATKILKLHGSINWSGSLDHPNITAEAAQGNYWNRSSAMLVFGGQATKLTASGPFLQLRQEFERSLLNSNRLIVIGYSFSDLHVNELIRRWISTRRRSKIVIIDPSIISFSSEVFEESYRIIDNEIVKNVDIVHIKRTALDGIALGIAEAQKPANMKVIRNRNGYLPHVLVRNIE